MNLGVYLSSLSDHDQLRDICDSINMAIDNKQVSDASIFYDNVGYNPFIVKCGIFNSTDLWNFSGKLITTSIASCLTALKIVNNIDLFYYYGWEKEVQTLSLIHLLSNKNVKLLSRTEDDDKDIYRKTGKKSIAIESSIKDIINKIG